MPNVAVIDVSQKIFDRSFTPEIKISENNICTITFKIVADTKPDIRTAPGKERGECRDASYGANLIQNNPKVRVKLVPEEKNDGRATLILEADLETKIPGTGAFRLTDAEMDKLEADYSASQIG